MNEEMNEEDFYNDEGGEDYDYDLKTIKDAGFNCCEQGYIE